MQFREILAAGSVALLMCMGVGSSAKPITENVPQASNTNPMLINIKIPKPEIASLYKSKSGNENRKAIKELKNRAIHGDPLSMDTLARCYRDGKMGVLMNSHLAAYWFGLAASKHYFPAMGALGRLMQLGSGVPKDVNKGFELIRAAAQFGDPDAQRYLADSYRIGRGVQQDESQAKIWAKKAVDQYRINIKSGDAATEFYLGMSYEDGKGIEKNLAEAIKLYVASAEGGFPYAQYKLGWFLETGSDIPKNLDEAIEWYETSAEYGYLPAIQKIAKLKPQNTLSSEWSQWDYIFISSEEIESFQNVLKTAKSLKLPEEVIDKYLEILNSYFNYQSTREIIGLEIRKAIFHLKGQKLTLKYVNILQNYTSLDPQISNFVSGILTDDNITALVSNYLPETKKEFIDAGINLLSAIGSKNQILISHAWNRFNNSKHDIRLASHGSKEDYRIVMRELAKNAGFYPSEIFNDRIISSLP